MEQLNEVMRSYPPRGQGWSERQMAKNLAIQLIRYAICTDDKKGHSSGWEGGKNEKKALYCSSLGPLQYCDCL